MLSLETKHDDSESEIHSQIGQIMDLMTRLNKKPSRSEESEDEMDESGHESS